MKHQQDIGCVLGSFSHTSATHTHTHTHTHTDTHTQSNKMRLTLQNHYSEIPGVSEI